MNIRKIFEQTDKLYHFTSFDTALKIIESNSLRFGRLTDMNDIHENDKVVFVDTSDSYIDNFSSEVLNALYDELYKYRQISFTIDNNKNDKKGFDLHQMWGLYADKGNGVCLVFDKTELVKELNELNVYHREICYDDTEQLDSFIISNSKKSKEVVKEVEKHIPDIFFHKRKEWEHEQEYRLLKKCHNANKEEYIGLGFALKFIILSSKLHNKDEVAYFNRVKKAKEMVKNIGIMGNSVKKWHIPILIYGNGLFDYTLGKEDGLEEFWNSRNGYDLLVPEVNCKLLL